MQLILSDKDEKMYIFFKHLYIASTTNQITKYSVHFHNQSTFHPLTHPPWGVDDSDS